MIQTLPPLTPNAQRSQRTIERCHQRLARRRKRLGSAAGGGNARYLAVERVLIGGLCVIYLSGVALVAIKMLSGS